MQAKYFKRTTLFFFSSRRRHTRCGRDWSSECALPIFQEQAGNRERLEAQLSVLRENRAATEADFAIGEQIRLAEEARKRAEEEARRKAAAAAAAAAAAEAAKNRPSPSTPAAPSNSGWV